MIKAVLDTSVIVSALRSRHGASNRLLQMAIARDFQIVATPALFLEYEDVLVRPEQLAATGLSGSRTQMFLTKLADIIVPVSVHFRWRPQLVDMNDEMVLDAAINGRADVLVTHNVKDFLLAAERFSLRILSPATMVREVLK